MPTWAVGIPEFVDGEMAGWITYDPTEDTYKCTLCNKIYATTHLGCDRHKYWRTWWLKQEQIDITRHHVNPSWDDTEPPASTTTIRQPPPPPAWSAQDSYSRRTIGLGTVK
jgi:hypothetical protein